MTFEKAFIYKKMEDIDGYLVKIKDLLKFSDNEILSDYIKFHTEERLFQLIVDAVIDINQHIIKELELKGAEDPQGIFYTLGEQKILPGKFAFKMAPVVAVRNRIVHGYESLDQALFTKNLRKHYSDFEKYIKFIADFLENKP
ncbi:MAG: hypothetical protein CEN87_92 [Parcubacteria group bacterium Licking1014_1]|nr:MAG: hypothetical protein CEN87_92 [Parcubacteria group bacterium Licking1014_1]